MPRPKTIADEELLRRAMDLFWEKGFEATSISDLITATGANRFALYGAFGDKRGLFLRALDHYAETFVGTALAGVETHRAGLDEVSGYFAALIDLAEAWGLPGPGCLMANSMAEVAPHDAAIRAKVRAHVERLRRGFEHALASAKGRGLLPSGFDPTAYAHFLTISAQGLWTYARICRDADELRRYAATLLEPLTHRQGEEER